jgi:hypothetical protein
VNTLADSDTLGKRNGCILEPINNLTGDHIMQSRSEYMASIYLQQSKNKGWTVGKHWLAPVPQRKANNRKASIAERLMMAAKSLFRR